jgi:thiol-disulfide isomerase/thioredoxin
MRLKANRLKKIIHPYTWPVGMLAVAALLLQSPFSPVESDEKTFGAAVEAAHSVDQRKYRVGQLIEDLAFKDLEGKSGKLSDYSKSKALVIAVRTIGCPLSKKYSPRINSIAKEYEKQGVAFVLVNVSESDKASDMAAEVKKYGLGPRYIVDSKQVIAKSLAATRTTDVFVLDNKRTLIYRGAIDDQYGLGFTKAAATKHYLKRALDSVLTGERLEVPATSAPGCELGLKIQSEPTTKITWHNRISRIVQQNCVECHRQGENGPFELVTYKDVKASRAMIKRVVGNKTMPPWFADGKVGDFSNDKSLSESDRKALLSWIEAGLPKGDKKDAVAKKKWYKGWRLGRPDSVISMPQAIDVPAEGSVAYQYVRLPTAFAEDKWVRALEVRPGVPEVVHHVLVFLKYPKNHPRARDQPRVRGGLRGYFAGMVPGQTTMVFPKGVAKFLPKGATMVFQIHYTTNGAAVKDKTKMGLFFAKGKPKHEVQTKGISTTRFRIPPGAGNHKVVAETTLRHKSRILGFNPHMHIRGKAFKYEIVNDDGSLTPLLKIGRYDFNWQLTYTLRKPLDLPAGTRLRASAWFDNSKENPANPDSSKTVRFGEQTWDEMMIGYFNTYKLND